MEQLPPEDSARKSGGTESPLARRYVLKDLLVDCTPSAMRDAFDWGPDLGREVVEE
jgi:hypothetical protein